MRLSGKIAIITGSASGIGKATAIRFAHEGASVAVTDLNTAGGQSTVDEIKATGGSAFFIEADVSNEASVVSMTEAVIDAQGRVDILVNNAAICEGMDVLDIASETWDRNLSVVLRSVYLCSRAVLPHMITRKQGSIVNIASVNGITAVGNAAYSAAKAGVINLTQNMACSYGEYGIRVNAIAPGTIRTEIWAEREKSNPNVFDDIADWYPLKRVGKPDEIASTALFLASDEASFATGALFVIDGGLTAGMRKWTDVAMASE
ncbi:MAG: glucose 1-dehydrogenase [Candidatus Latescibacteria bacterium]|jgi:meso-butanediol dehydrogenase / (S,S)-butanediol dehydrogenase / diacetyl reductase|nr:glucose 1-dehydrogenase [Candidatus Latescibacterota bacterium]